MLLPRRGYITSGLWEVVLDLSYTRYQAMQDFMNFPVVVGLCGMWFRTILSYLPFWYVTTLYAILHNCGILKINPYRMIVWFTLIGICI